MDNLPDWAAPIIAVAVGLSPGIAILSARSIARLLYRVLGRAWKERAGRVLGRRMENRPGFQLHEGEGPARASY
jgi:hypothetical protein